MLFFLISTTSHQILYLSHNSGISIRNLLPLALFVQLLKLRICLFSSDMGKDFNEKRFNMKVSSPCIERLGYGIEKGRQ